MADTSKTASRVAVVTGAAEGIGQGIAARLARAGYRVALLDIQAQAAERAAAALNAAGGRTAAFAVDVTSQASIAEALAGVRSTFGPISIMIANAGIDGASSFAKITLEDWNRIIAVNLTGVFLSVQAALPDMIDAGWGRVVTISSQAAQSGGARRAHYAASKGGVIALTKALAAEVAPKGVTVNTIPPSIIRTPMSERGNASGALPNIDEIAKLTPVRRAGTPDDIAAACEFLCSEDAGFITGQIIGVNGGWYM